MQKFCLVAMIPVLVCGVAQAQTASRSGTPSGDGRDAAKAEAVRRPSLRPEVDTLRKMHKPITVEFKDQQLSAVMEFIAGTTGADLEIMWADDRVAEGLNKESVINVECKNLTALSLVERVLAAAAAAEGQPAGTNSWQMSETGEMQIGPKSRLNAFKRVEMYSIDDLLTEVPNFLDAPEFNLQTVLQGARGGGQSPFTDGNEEEPDVRTRQQKIDELVDLITTTVEPEQWDTSAGGGASIRSFQGSLLVNGADYIHRQLAGYPYWRGKLGGSVRGSRYVGLGVNTATSQINSFNNVPVNEPPK
jgi:hypothetical protein